MKEAIYTIVDFFTFGKGLKKKINNRTLQLPTRYINYFPSDYESDNFNFLEQQCNANNIVLDIGAHIGLFSIVAAQIVGSGGKVYAFEPTPKTNALLNKTVNINKQQQVIEIRTEAMGAQPGKTVFFISDREGDNGNSLVSYKEDRKINGIDITVQSIDNFVKEKKLQKINFIKIDVEGAEFDVLHGAVETFNKFKPACILSIHPDAIAVKGDKLADIYDFIKKINYYFFSKENTEFSKEKFCANTILIDLHLLPL